MPSLPRVVPKYRSKGSGRLPPAKPPLFRSVVAHPPPPFASASTPGDAQASTSKPVAGPRRVIYTTAPRPLIPLTTSPVNHILWNPPAPDAKGSRVVERDESGRLARFASRFGGNGVDGEGQGDKQFAAESDLSFLEGATLQSPERALGKGDIVGVPKTAKKGRK